MRSRVRDAQTADAAPLATIHVRSWQAAYRGIFPDAFLEALDVGRRERWRWNRLGNPPPRTATLLVELDGRPVGFTDLGPATGLDETGEIYAFYLHPDHWGRGHGRALMEAAVQRLRSSGFAEAILWVVAENSRARHFYEAAGWRPDGVRRIEEIGGVQANELRYRRSLRLSPASSPRVSNDGPVPRR